MFSTYRKLWQVLGHSCAQGSVCASQMLSMSRSHAAENGFIGLKTLFQRFSLTGGMGQSLPLCTLSTQAFCFYYKMFAYWVVPLETVLWVEGVCMCVCVCVCVAPKDSQHLRSPFTVSLKEPNTQTWYFPHSECPIPWLLLPGCLQADGIVCWNHWLPVPLLNMVRFCVSLKETIKLKMSRKSLEVSIPMIRCAVGITWVLV